MKKPIIYQVFTRLFGNRNTSCVENGTIEDNGCGKMNDIDMRTLRRIRDLGATHVWYTGLLRHATQTDYSRYGIPVQNAEVVKGRAGSPYAITDYYDVDPDLAVDVENRMAELDALIERTHKAGLKVVIDFVPNHVARQYKSVCKPHGMKDLGEDDDTNLHFSIKNNFYYCWGQKLNLCNIAAPQTYEENPAKATGNDRFTSCPDRNDWYETVKLNYGIDYCDAGGRSEHFSPIPDTWHKMTAILLFWAKKGVDAFRCDMAEMVPAAFWQWATDKVKFSYPEIMFIGEVYNPALYRSYIGSGFDWLYDKVGMYDCVRNAICGYGRADEITLQWQATDDISRHMLYFLENHDEQRIASDFFAGDARKALPGLLVSVLMQNNPFMLYAGQEFGEPGMDKEGFSGKDGRTTIFDYWTVESLRRGYYDRRAMTAEEKRLENIYKYVLNLANAEKAFTNGEFFDLMYMNHHIGEHQYAFLRKADNELMLVVANFSRDEASCDVVIPSHAIDYLAIPEKEYTATDLLSNEQCVMAVAGDQSVTVTVPPYGGRIYKIEI